MHGLPWTMHLQGMYNILQSHGVENFPAHQDTPFRMHLFEVMGVMDMPTFTIGRQTPSIGVWRKYCRNAGGRGEDVEQVSGLPRSLLDIFSCIDAGTTEETFLDWPGEPGTFLQCHLWEAFRLAGLLACRQRSRFTTIEGQESRSPISSSSLETPSSAISIPSQRLPQRLPRTEVLVSRILASLDALRRECAEPREQDRGTLILNAIEYPVFVVGLEVDLINRDPDMKKTIRESLDDLYRGETEDQNRMVKELLEDLWKNGSGVDVNQLVQRKGLELGLF